MSRGMHLSNRFQSEDDLQGSRTTFRGQGRPSGVKDDLQGSRTTFRGQGRPSGVKAT
jgi:hypothetical protein